MRKENNDGENYNTPEDGRRECLDPAVGASLYDYYNGALEPADVYRFERHLVRCARCEATIAQLDQMMAQLDEEENFNRPNRSEDPGTMVELGV